jgi:bifunctional DNA-binding transcriptional regulator/antitoxin component of YhaV-PrlF toxin-antitoxin module
MRSNETVLGTSKVDPRYRITLVQPIPELLGVNVGDLVVFVQDEEGNIIIRVSSIPSAKLSKRRGR